MPLLKKSDKKSSNKKSSKDDVFHNVSPPAPVPVVLSIPSLIPLSELKNFLDKEEKNNYETLHALYKKLGEESKKEALENNKSCLCGSILGNVDKNRYRNILPFDYNRVILGRTWEEFKKQQQVDPSLHLIAGNYINASYIGVCNTSFQGEVVDLESIASPKFITTQEPLETTIGDFWKMVYEQRSPMIINLTGATDDSESTCYWPQELNKKVSYSTCGDRMWVQFTHEAQKPVWVERAFKIWPEGQENLFMFVRHMQYMGWAINSSPAASNLLKFIDDIAKPAVQIAPTAGPIVVQSRGGIGRNGFFITACLLKQNIEMGMKGVDLVAMIKHLRRYYTGLVNCPEYFIALHKFALQIYNQIQSGGFSKLEYLVY
ncbi:hypothetical protein Aperf_G00000045969 [Anoplocephala perfoliata]